MKKIIPIVLFIVMSLACACGNNGGKQDQGFEISDSREIVESTENLTSIETKEDTKTPPQKTKREEYRFDECFDETIKNALVPCDIEDVYLSKEELIEKYGTPFEYVERGGPNVAMTWKNDMCSYTYYLELTSSACLTSMRLLTRNLDNVEIKTVVSEETSVYSNDINENVLTEWYDTTAWSPNESWVANYNSDYFNLKTYNDVASYLNDPGHFCSFYWAGARSNARIKIVWLFPSSKEYLEVYFNPFTGEKYDEVPGRHYVFPYNELVTFNPGRY